MNTIRQQIIELLQKAGVNTTIELTTPPKPEMGDFAFGCFEIAKALGKNPAEAAKDIVERFKIQDSRLISEVKAAGPYVNFYLNANEVAKLILVEAEKKDFGESKLGKGKKIMVEFAHPNTHKAFHIGHLRNITTGESLVRILENVGYEVIRANYQGDVGMHIAKSLWGIEQLKDEYEIVKNKPLHDRIEFLGKAYAHGGKAYEDSEQVQAEVKELNKKIYSRDASIQEVYQITRAWSLEYFDHVYARVGSHFDRLYFESEVYESGEKIVRKFLQKGVFEESQGAIIFPGSKHGLHDRVFITSQGFPGYEAKDLGLAELQFKEYKPEAVYHVVACEQSGYFEVLFKALEQTLPESTGKEHHLIYGWVSLKEGKMSSRTGNVVLGEWLLDEVKKQVLAIMKESQLENKEEVAEKIAVAAVKYAFLKTGRQNDIKFDFKESVSTSGDSGPYLLYIVARIKSILKKCKMQNEKCKKLYPEKIENAEKQLILQVGKFSEAAEEAASKPDPSKIAQYLFDLAQSFNTFYHECPVLKAEDELVQAFRLGLIRTVGQVMEQGLYLLGIRTVEEM